MTRHLYNIFGWISLGLGVIGIFLPLLPTTPFVLLASYCFSRGSEKMHRWLREHEFFGFIILDWEEHKAIRRKTKLTAITLLVLFLSYPILFSTLHVATRVILFSIALTVSIFICTRPSVPES